MIKITSNDVIDFVEYIVSDNTLKNCYCDSWLHINLIKHLFQKFKQCNDDFHHKTFMNKMYLIAESQSHALHHKKVWNNADKVSVDYNLFLFIYFRCINYLRNKFYYIDQ